MCEKIGIELRVVALDRLERFPSLVARRRVERLAVRAQRTSVPVVSNQGGKQCAEAGLEEFRVVRVVGDFAAGGAVRLGGGVCVDAQDPRGGKNRTRVVRAIRGDFAHDGHRAVLR